MKQPIEPDFIRVIDNSLPNHICDEIIRIFNNSPNIQQGRTGGGVDIDKKHSYDVSIQRHKEFESILEAVFKTSTIHIIEYLKDFHFALIGPIALTFQDLKSGETSSITDENFKEIGIPNIENLVRHIYQLGEISVQKYEKGIGGYPYWHSEIYPKKNDLQPLHRSLLFMFYLNDVDDGGETDFYYQNKSIQPKKGRMVIAPAGFTHTHRGNKPNSSDKFILTSWVLFNSADTLYP
ncbi:2OG-Fe(II) oxygenase [Glaciecola petra]|uniref:2OG-Fe(II) oxygenase n=1 Tax=Glaciecola petra TaxID=3075602 RepID=A0ABU2ZSP8_9ALTE|nr:2OG-Fe(II) oxygenase [Aestuariibacter sp. P117]MDT0595665.1 2OG-Fe(II) oxygenase [Aestuariibacter sp. P117]